MSTVYDFEALQINGKSVSLNQFKGKAMHTPTSLAGDIEAALAA